jgi:hypothetical protein
MYTGPTDGLTRWFTSLGYHYDPSDHGMASDWALDLVSLGFAKPQQGARPAQQQVGMPSQHVPSACCRTVYGSRVQEDTPCGKIVAHCLLMVA